MSASPAPIPLNRVETLLGSDGSAHTGQLVCGAANSGGTGQRTLLFNA